MDVSLCPAKCSFWRIFLLGSVWLDYVGSVLACPANCVCSKTEISCRRPDDGNLFPLLEGQDSGNSTGNASINITDISRNITSIHIENWRGLHTLNAVDMELYTGLQKLTIKNSGLRSIQPRAFAKNPHLRYINLSSNRLTTLSWQLFQTLSLRELRLEQNFFNCSCDIRWMQLWQEQGEARLNSQNLYCVSAEGSQLPLFRMNISQCDLPEISVSHVNLTVREGDNAVITCNGSGSPLPDVDWIVSGLQSINTHQTNLNWTNVHAINLTLVNVTSEDNGFTLTCIAENVVGMSNASVSLTVHYPPRVVSLEEPELRLEHCIEFVVRGNPPPTLHWLHNGQPLRESRIIRVEYYQEGEVSEGCLLFNKPTHYNNGNYTLVAKNPLGTANQTINGHFLKEPFPVYEVSPTPPITVTHKPEEDTFGVSIAVGLAAFACVLLVVLFIMINKYGRRSKFGMKGASGSAKSGSCNRRQQSREINMTVDRETRFRMSGEKPHAENSGTQGGCCKSLVPAPPHIAALRAVRGGESVLQEEAWRPSARCGPVTRQIIQTREAAVSVSGLVKRASDDCMEMLVLFLPLVRDGWVTRDSNWLSLILLGPKWLGHLIPEAPPMLYL
ncbi:NT-3 growth factor receptor [Pteropus alecto]|uniref:NT-3 growth factor receptor n=1 Tax=Pteropus alecto TaxID=9402 RepID=L5L489_PTEAL|nr:NT-3 growth factor receptor [Pteropus alecto]